MSTEPGGPALDLPEEFLKLNPRYQRFVLAYLTFENAAEAARQAGFSKANARAQGCELLQRPEIKFVLDLLKKREIQRLNQKYEINRDRIAEELARIAFGNPKRVLTWKGGEVHVRDESEISEADAAFIKNISFSTSDTRQGLTVSRSIAFQDKTKALELLGKSVGMFSDDPSRNNDQEPAKDLKNRISNLRRKYLGE